MIANPILPGFHPDPSLCRVHGEGGDDYYIATSTFEWWPGVRIHHSRDLVNWRHQGYAVTRTSQLDLTGHPDSGGVWAPCLSYAHGQFWLIYSDVRSIIGAFKDTHNYLITAPTIDGPWSEPIYLNSSGFDPSLFHDEDGRSWLVNQQWIHTPGKHHFNGILLQEYDHEAKRLVGPVKNIYAGTPLGVVEGPHLYRRNGWYYLLTAEGGTFYEHAVTLARSRHIDGPYETLPGNPLLTAWQKPTDGLQRAGHASLVETATGEWFMAHLCGRPLEWSGPNADRNDPASGYAGLHCPLGRETALQRIQWRDDDWPEVVGAKGQQPGQQPILHVAAPNLPAHPFPAEPARDDFDSATFSGHLNSLRKPFDESWASLTERPGYLRLKGRESLMSTFDQSLVARRQQHFNCRAETRVDFEPENFHQMAGLVAYYNTRNHAYLHVTCDPDSGERVAALHVNRDGAYSANGATIPLAAGPVDLAVEFSHDTYQFHVRQHGGDWQAVGTALDAAMLSDEFATRFSDGFARSFGFTGNFIGLACQDLAGTRKHADFDYLTYQPKA